jgi:hypothetical protein
VSRSPEELRHRHRMPLVGPPTLDRSTDRGKARSPPRWGLGMRLTLPRVSVSVTKPNEDSGWKKGKGTCVVRQSKTVNPKCKEVMNL